MCSRPEAPTVCRAVHWGCKCVCVPVWGALHSCHARGSTLLAQLAVRIGRWTRLQQCPPFLAVGGWRGLLSANGDGEGLNTMQASLLWAGRCCNLASPADTEELGHRSAFVCQNTVICVELRTPRWLKATMLTMSSPFHKHYIASARVWFIPRGFFFFFFFFLPLWRNHSVVTSFFTSP